MSITKPKATGVLRPICPVCGKTAYSHGGIHPQCATKRADTLARKLLSAAVVVALPQPQ